MNHIYISASAVSAILGRTGMKRAAKKGWSQGFYVTGYDVVVEVGYSTTDPAEQAARLDEILALFNGRRGYRAELGQATPGSTTQVVKVYRTEESTRVPAAKAVAPKVQEPKDGPAAKAASVSRFLGSRGFVRSEYHASGMVRGYGESTKGYQAQQSGSQVTVEWNVGRSGFRLDSESRHAEQVKQLTAIKEALEERWDVELRGTESVQSWPRLAVTQRRWERAN
jgi:hypothetical protein